MSGVAPEAIALSLVLGVLLGLAFAAVEAVRALYRHRREQEARGKRLYIADERFLKEAERLIEDEFAVSLEIEPKEVRPFIEHRLQTA